MDLTKGERKRDAHKCITTAADRIQLLVRGWIVTGAGAGALTGAGSIRGAGGITGAAGEPAEAFPYME